MESAIVAGGVGYSKIVIAYEGEILKNEIENTSDFTDDCMGDVDACNKPGLWYVEGEWMISFDPDSAPDFFPSICRPATVEDLQRFKLL